MRAVYTFGLALVVATVGIVACVGDDPGSAPVGPSNDGGNGSVDAPVSNPNGDSGGIDVRPDGGSDAGDAAPPFEVRSVPGLRLWLESTRELTKASVGNDIVSWLDSSGRWEGDAGAGGPAGGKHAAVPVAYNGGGAVYPGVVTNAINGRPAVTFTDGTKLAITNHTDFAFGTGDFVIAAVGTVSSGSGPFWRLMTATTAPSGTFLGASNACTFLGALGAEPDCTSPDFTPNTSAHVFVMRRKAAQMIFRVDGTSRGTYDFGVDNPDLTVLDFQQANIFIGGGLVGQVAELVVVVGPTPDAELDTLEAHLKTKYALP